MTKDVGQSPSRWHHWVPRAYLRRWSLDRKRVCTYETLVPHEKYPIWEMRPIRSVAAADHLYTTTRDGSEPDAFERYLKDEIEDPALDALARAESGGVLSQKDHHRITYFAMALDQRTPSAFADHAERWNKQLPQMMRDVLQGAKKKLERAARRGVRIEQFPVAGPLPPIQVNVRVPGNGGDARLETSVVSGRELWLWAIQNALEVTAPKLIASGGLTWSIIAPPSSTEWFTSDHPLLRMNYHAWNNVSFGGGWGFKGSEIMLPLSPHALLYSKVAYTYPPHLAFDRGQCLTVQSILARRAYRAIFATSPMPRVESMRRRVVDCEVYEDQKRQLERWHEANLEQHK